MAIKKFSEVCVEIAERSAVELHEVGENAAEAVTVKSTIQVHLTSGERTTGKLVVCGEEYMVILIEDPIGRLFADILPLNHIERITVRITP